MSELTLDQQNFKTEVEDFSGVVLVDFWAPWCGPCRIQGPIIDELAQENKDDNVKVAKLNVDDNQPLAQKFGVMSIPTLLIFKNGQVVDQMVGVNQKNQLLDKIQNLQK